MVLNKKLYLFFQKYSRREFWPGYIVDIPIYFYRLYLSLKSGSLVFFSNINPGMFFSGFTGYGKHSDVDRFEKNLLPKMFLVEGNESRENIEKKMIEGNIIYPCIAKPTLGRTGRDVKKINNERELKKYILNAKENIVVQEFINNNLEFGIFYYRIPGENKGHITGIVEKKFMFINGNGIDTFEKLIYNHPRAKYYYDSIKKDHEAEWGKIVEEGKKIQLNYLGNHCRGSTFFDVSHLISPKLEETIDKISKQADGFYFGRYDIKVNSIEDLIKGNFKIIELNGVGSLPTHIYDPKHSLWHAYKVLFQHRKIAYRISKENYKNGHKYIGLKKAIEIVKEYGI